MKQVNFSKMKEMQAEVAIRIVQEGISIEQVRYVAGFEVVFSGDNCHVGAAVFDFKTMEVVETKSLVTKSPMNYIPGLSAFRIGPVICQLYYGLEYDPDVILIVGEGISHPEKCGAASFVGVELAKPTIGVAKNSETELKDGTLIIDGEIFGKNLSTRDYARPVFVSIGNMIDLDTAVEIVKKMIVPPHKMPEPLHIARKVAKNASEQKAHKEPAKAVSENEQFV